MQGQATAIHFAFSLTAEREQTRLARRCTCHTRKRLREAKARIVLPILDGNRLRAVRIFHVLHQHYSGTHADMVRIELSTLREGISELTLTPSPESLDLDADIFSDIRVDLELDAAKDRIVARYFVIAEAHLVCDRTAQPFQQQVEGSHLVMFTRAVDAETDDPPADTKVFVDTDQYLELTDEVRDTLVLSLPTRRIAPGADELDIPTTFGVEREDETDPRWDELRKLQN